MLDAFDFLKPKHDYKGFVKEVLVKELFGSTDDLTVTKEESEWRLIYLFMFFTNILIIVSSVQILSNSIEYEAAVYYSPRVSISKQAIGKENNIRRTLMYRIFTGFGKSCAFFPYKKHGIKTREFRNHVEIIVVVHTIVSL